MNNIDNPQPRKPIRGLEDAQNLLKSRMKSFMLLKENQTRNLNQPEQPANSSLLNQSNQCGKTISRYQPFDGQAQQISISERVKRASQCHGKMLDEIEKTRISHYQSVETALNAVKTSVKTDQNISFSFQNDVESKNTVSQSKPFQFHSFSSNSQPRNNLQNQTSIQSEKPSNSLFSNSSGQNLNNQVQQPGNKFVFPNTNTNTATGTLGLFGQVNSEIKSSQPQNSQNKYQASSNLFGQVPQQNNLFAKSNGNGSFSNQATPAFENPKQSQKPQIPLEPAKPALNLFAEHLFTDVKQNKNAKPSLLFNNNSIPAFPKKKEEKQTSEIKVIFNNNGTVVPKIVPSTNIFGGQLNIQPQKEELSIEKGSNEGQNQSIFAPKINTQTEVQPSVISQTKQFSPLKFIEPQRAGLFGIEPKTQENNSNQQISEGNSGIFGNQTASIPKQQQPNRPLFETTPVPAKEENRYTFGKATTDNNQIKLFLSNKESNGSSGVTLPQSKPNPQKLQPAKLQLAKPVLGLFGNQSLPTTNIFGAKKQPQQTSAPKPTAGLFGNLATTNSNVEKQQPQKKESVKPVLGLFSSNQTPNLFGGKNFQQNSMLNTNASVNNLFSKKTEPNLTSAIPTQNMFAKSATGLFAKAPVQNKTFGQVTSSNNIFAPSNQPSNNIFLSNQNSSGLFSGNQSLFSNNSQSLFGGNNQKRGAGLFTNTQDNDNQDDDDADDQEAGDSDDNLEENPSEEEQKGQMKFKDYIQTQIFAKAEANKLKIVSEDKLLNDMKLSLQKISDDPKTYLIARLPNKNIAFYVLFISKSELNILNEKQGVINLSIKSLFQIDVLNGNKKSIDSWRIQVKESPDSRKFIAECQKLIKKALQEDQSKTPVEKQVQKETQKS